MSKGLSSTQKYKSTNTYLSFFAHYSLHFAQKTYTAEKVDRKVYRFHLHTIIEKCSQPTLAS